MKKLLFLYIVLIANTFYSQGEFIKTKNPVQAASMKSDKKELAFSSLNTIYIVDLENFIVKDSVYIKTHKDYLIKDLHYIPANENFLFFKKKDVQRLVDMPFLEYPKDSVFIYDLAMKKVVTSMPGNNYFDISTDPNKYVGAYNNFFEYESYGKTDSSPSRGELIANEIRKPASGIIHTLAMDPNLKRVAVVYYDSISTDHKYHYTLEMRTYPELEIINSRGIINKPIKILFTDNSEHIILKKALIHPSFSEELEVIQISSLETISELPPDFSVMGIIENNSVWQLEDAEIVNKNYNSEKRNFHIWPNLTPFSRIEGFIKINEEELVIFGPKQTMLANPSNGLIKYSLKDNSLFSTMPDLDVIQDTLMNPAVAIIQNNALQTGNVQTDKLAEKMLVQKETGFQLWSVKDRRKLYDFKFENELSAFLSTDGNSVLLLEKFPSKGFSDFSLKVLNLQTGMISSKIFMDNPFMFFDPNNGSLCYNNAEGGEEWICTDYRSGLWKINSTNLTIELIKTIENEEYKFTTITNFKKFPGSNSVVYNSRSYDIDDKYNETRNTINPIHIYNMSTGKEESITELNNVDFFFPISPKKFIWKKTGNFQSYNIESRKSENVPLNNFTIHDVVVNEDRVYLLSEQKDSLDVLSMSVSDNKIDLHFKLPINSTNHFLSREGLNYFDSGNVFTHFPEYNKTISWNSSKPFFSQKHDLDIVSNGYLLFRNEWLVNLKSLEVETRIPKHKYSVILNNPDTPKILLIDDQRYNNIKKNFFQFKIASAVNTDDIFWESEMFEYKGLRGNPDRFTLSPNKNYAIAYTSHSSILDNVREYYLIDILKKEVSKFSANAEIANVSFSKDDNEVIINTLKNLNRGSIVHNISQGTIVFHKDYQTVTEEGISLYVENQSVVVTDHTLSSENNLSRYFSRDYLSVAHHIPNKNLIVAGSTSGSLFFWKMNDFSPIKRLEFDDSEILFIKDSGNKLFVLSKNSTVKVIDLNKLELDVTLAFSENEKNSSLAWFTPEGYFKATKEDIRNLHFVKNSSSFPLANYELFLNRPDIIMDRLGFANSETISIYNAAYKKRLQRSGFKEEDFIVMEKPELTLINRNAISPVTELEKIQLNIKGESKVQIKEIAVYVNGVKVLKEDKSYNLSKLSSGMDLAVDLNGGKNQINVVAINNKGIESDPISLEVECLVNARDAKVYYIGIGVSKYADSTMNLNFADKDVRSLAAFFKKKFKDRIVIDTLTNEIVTKERLKDIKSILSKTDINDMVIISFSGHGLVDENYNFFFATHDIDFNVPQNRGFSYQAIEELLEGIPARRKLLLLDACHSGEIDGKEDLVQVEKGNQNVTGFVPKGSKVINSKKSKEDIDNSFELMKSLFYDLDRGNGSYVIAASGGKEFAYESAEWQNGVFTYSFLNAMNELGNSSYNNNDGVIHISELRDYIYNSVVKLTNGQQKPTARTENIEWDWVID